jgi:hypothetical protein
MTMTNSEQAQFEEYFQLQHSIDVSIEIGGPLAELPTYGEFDEAIPLPFKLASEMKGVEQNMLRPLRQLGDVIEPLANYLKAQSRKIDLMMSYILQAQEQESIKLKTLSYGGGGFVLKTEHSIDTDHWLTCKMYFHDDAAAIYCLGRVIKIDNDSDMSVYTILFERIREEDREVVVRASLHQQSKQLLKKTQENKNNNGTAENE